MTMFQKSVLVCTGLLALADCSKPAPAMTFGEPVAIRMEAESGASYVLLVAAAQGEDLRSTVGSIASTMHSAVRACPGSIPPSPQSPPTTIQTTTTDSSLQIVKPANATTAESCVAGQLEGKPLGGFLPKSSYVLQVRNSDDKELSSR